MKDLAMITIVARKHRRTKQWRGKKFVYRTSIDLSGWRLEPVRDMVAQHGVSLEEDILESVEEFRKETKENGIRIAEMMIENAKLYHKARGITATDAQWEKWKEETGVNALLKGND